MPAGEGKHRETARHHAAFEEWYKRDRDTSKTSQELEIKRATLKDWEGKYRWNARADARDREAAARADREAIRRRAAMLIKCRQAGELLVGRGVERLGNKPLESDQAAIAAIGKGVEIWRQAEGLPAWVIEILTADVSQLEQRERLLLERRRRAGIPDGPEGEAGEELLALPANGDGRE
jgi:hypothetical protein